MSKPSPRTLFVRFGLLLAICTVAALAMAQGKGEPSDPGGGPPEQCVMENGQPRPEMTVTVTKTADGATLTLTAKNPADVAKIQHKAANMAKYLQDVCKPKPNAGAGKGPAGAK
jgi:hypothetical protein